MKKLPTYIYLLVIVIGALITSCTDTTFNDGNSNLDNASVKLTLCLPCGDIASTRAGGTDASTGEEDGEDYERQLSTEDIHLLIFENNQLKEEVFNLQLRDQGNGIKELYGITANTYNSNVDIVVLANLKNSKVNFDSNSYLGQSKETIYESLKYSFEDFNKNKTKGIPMWGSITLPQIVGNVNADIDLYRAVAKIGITVNEGKGLDNFTLTSVRAYFANTEGYCTPINVTASELANKEILSPSIPATSEQYSVASPIVFDKLQSNDFKNQLYISEANNKLPGEGKNAVCLVVGGIYDGEGLVDAGKECFYRIDFKDDLESGNKDNLKAYDLVRNHLYQFDIVEVSNPGTPTPEDALDNVVVGMKVTIADWTDVPMRGVPDQYTLTTDKSVVNFENISSGTETVIVTTDYGQMSGSTENGPWTIVEKSADATWFTVEQGNDNRTIYISVEDNYGVAREGRFFIQTGNIKKEILVRQKQPKSANSYVVGDGTHTLIVTIKGNGNEGLVAEGKTLDTDASLKPAKIGIIWETKAGLVKLIDAKTNAQISGGASSFASYDESKGTIQYIVNTNGATIGGVTGGNALIGAFDENNNILWSWHIWACPDMIDNNKIKEACVQDWTLNGYKVLDRNLGALSNSPGVASLGLLYQWGRKDPFIGAKYTNDEFTGNGVLDTQNYGYNWGVESNSRNTTIEYTIKNPTTLTLTGLSESSIGEKRQYLWGSNEGLSTTIKDLGTKTIYDPCPEGYRVPPVDAFVFSCTRREPNKTSSWTKVSSTTLNNVYIRWSTNKYGFDGLGGENTVYEYRTSVNPLNDRPDSKFDYYQYRTIKSTSNTKSSNISNWNENLKYIPHKVKERSWQDEGQYLYSYSGDYVGTYDNWEGYKGNADYYGFYLNYKEVKEPITKYGNMYELIDYSNVAWLPLTGAYNPKEGFAFKKNGSTVSIEQGSSLTVNSFLWTNSSVKNGNNWIPAAMFLHGTETKGGGSGRHIHGMTQSNIKADPRYAGAVRCVRDVKKDFSESNKVPDGVEISKTVGGTVESNLISVNDTWAIVDGGAPWLKISPDRGTPDKGKGQNINFTTLQTNNTGSARTATVYIKFDSEAAPRSFKVTQSK